MKLKLIFLFLFSLSFCITKAQDDGNIYIYRGGVITFETKADTIDSIDFGGSTGKRLAIFSKKGERLYQNYLSMMDSITFSYPVPSADLMNIVFHSDGTAQDISPMKHVVTVVNNNGFYNYYNNTYKRYAARFNNTWGGTPSGNYRIDYADNTAFKNALADGHSIETLVMAHYDGATPPNSEAKPFTSHQAGGTGFLITTTSATGKNEITFLPNVSADGTTSNWRETRSGIVPQSGTYYHIVG